jgi:hypothetical protein
VSEPLVGISAPVNWALVHASRAACTVIPIIAGTILSMHPLGGVTAPTGTPLIKPALTGKPASPAMLMKLPMIALTTGVMSPKRHSILTVA